MQSIIDFGHGSVPWLQIPANGKDRADPKLPTIHLSPANGIPVASYQSFINEFVQVANVTGMNCRGAWPNQEPPPADYNWTHHADDLIAALESQHQSPVIGMGHSIGGTVTALAAAQRPDLFSKLVIIEPATLPYKMMVNLFHALPQWASFRLFSFIKKTHDRKKIWPSREAFIDNYRQHPTYRAFTDVALHDYAQHGLFKREDGQFELLFQPDWESFNFRRVHYLWSTLKHVIQPTLLLRAGDTYMYSQRLFDNRNKNLGTNVTAKTIPNTGHLLTHENPTALSGEIINWLNADNS